MSGRDTLPIVPLGGGAFPSQDDPVRNDCMQRREFITLLGSAVAWPVTARTQEAALRVIGFLTDGSPISGRNLNTQPPFHQGLTDAGFVEGRNLKIEYCWAEEDYSRLPGLAVDLVRRQVAVLGLKELLSARHRFSSCGSALGPVHLDSY
jgi:hypothetical protein